MTDKIFSTDAENFVSLRRSHEKKNNDKYAQFYKD